MIETFIQDLRIGLRVLVKDKGFCAIAVTVLALGIGAVATQFSVVNAVFLRGFSFPNADRMVSVQLIDPTSTNFFGVNSQIFSLDYQEIRETQKSLEMMAAYINGSTVNMTYDGVPQRYTGAYVTDEFMKILGVAPILGRDFTPADNTPGAPKVTIISYQLWQRDFGGTNDVIGKAVRLNGKAATIIGVMPPKFAFPINEQLWIPLFNEFVPQPRSIRNAPGNQPAVLALIRKDVSLDQANAEYAGIAKRLADAYPDTNKAFGTARIQELIKTFSPQQLRGLLFVMLAFCVGVLLLACINVMNMQFARATLRSKELAIRSSLGASRFRLLRQMLTESLLVAVMGAVLGIGLAFWATDTLMAATRNLANPIPAYIVFDLDKAVLAIVVIATVVAAIVSGLIPAWMASSTNATEALKDSGRGNTGRIVGIIMKALVVFQILVTCLLLIGSLLQLKSILKQGKIDYGYDTQAVLTARMGLMDGDYPTSAARKLFYDRVARELENHPEIADASITTRFQMVFSGNGPIEIEGKEYKEDRDRPNANFENISEGYFETLGMQLKQGRDFNADDSDAKQPVAIVNAGFAAKHFGNEDPIGRRFRTVGNNGTVFGPWRTIVGVVSNVRMTGPFNQGANVDETGFYVPFYSTIFGPALEEPQAPQFATVIIRPEGGIRADTQATLLRREINKVDPNLPLYFVATPKQNQDGFLGQNKIIATMFSIFGAVAVILSAAGLYGVMSFAVSQRTQEFGIRMALGANTQKILSMVMKQGFTQLAIGLGLGLGLALLIAFLGGGAISQQLFEVSPRDPVVYAGVALLITAVAAFSTWFPARRATRVDPINALRAE